MTKEELIRLFNSLDPEARAALLSTAKKGAEAGAAPSPAASGRWFDRKLCGLSKDGLAHLRELEEQSETTMTSRSVDRKQLRYLRTFKKMKLQVPAFFRQTVDPKVLYRKLLAFCRENDLPDEIVSRMVPALVQYIDCGHMRPILFVGEKGCGKTTAVRMLVEEALKLPTKVIKVPQTDGGHGMTGDCGSYVSADAGELAKARLQANSLLVAYVFDEIDKVTHDRNRAAVDDELLSATDESNTDVYDNYLETSLVALEHCPMFFTANDLQKVNPILADRCTVIRFPSANASRIKAITKKYVDKKLSSRLYQTIDFDYGLLEQSIDLLVSHDVTSLRKHQQMVEAVLEKALTTSLTGEDNKAVPVTKDMFDSAVTSVLGTVRRRAGF